MLTYAHPDGEDRNILVDCGKTFRQVVHTSLAGSGLRKLHALLLTHPHADAMMGLDDLREIPSVKPLPVYCDAATLQRVSEAFPYLVDTSGSSSKGTSVARLAFRVIAPWVPFVVEGTDVVVTPIPVEHSGEWKGHGDTDWHGDCLAFEFGLVDGSTLSASDESNAEPSPAALAVRDVGEGTQKCAAAADDRLPSLPPLSCTRIVYISDARALSGDVVAWLKSRRIDVLILDALFYWRHPTHFSFMQAVNAAADLRAGVTRLVGMCHAIDHYSEDDKLQQWMKQHGDGIDVGLAWDGWSVPVSLGSATASSVEAMAADVQLVRGAAARLLLTSGEPHIVPERIIDGQRTKASASSVSTSPISDDGSQSPLASSSSSAPGQVPLVLRWRYDYLHPHRPEWAHWEHSPSYIVSTSTGVNPLGF